MYVCTYSTVCTVLQKFKTRKMSPSSAGANMSVAFWFANTGGLRRLTAQGRSGLGQVRISCIAGRLELDRTHIHRGSVVKSWPKFCKVRDCGVCRARRSRGGLFPLAYSPSKAIGRNSQKSGIPTEILKISVFGLSCVRAIVYASVIRSAPQKSPPPFLDFTTPFTTPFFRGPWPSMETSLQADRKIRGTGFLSKTRELG